MQNKCRKIEYTEEQKAEIVRLYNMGYGSPTIGIKMKLPSSPIYKWLTDNGYRRYKTQMLAQRKSNNIKFLPCKKYPDITDEQKVIVIKLWNEGYGSTTIARQIQCHYSAVQRYLREMNLHRTHRQSIDVRPNYGVTHAQLTNNK
jgi:intein-encoded DNA endonuclease-like protein